MAKETLKLMDLSKARVWVEINPKVVLPTLIEVKDGEWIFTVTVTILGNEEGNRFQMTESTRFREESRMQGEGAYVRPRQIRQGRGSLVKKAGKSWRSSSDLRFQNSNGLWVGQEYNSLRGKRKEKGLNEEVQSKPSCFLKPNTDFKPKYLAKPRDNFLRLESKTASFKGSLSPIKA